eukprot:scaffold52639_cov18-Tisochrysis_lutea.AAC.1
MTMPGVQEPTYDAHVQYILHHHRIATLCVLTPKPVNECGIPPVMRLYMSNTSSTVVSNSWAARKKGQNSSWSRWRQPGAKHGPGIRRGRNKTGNVSIGVEDSTPVSKFPASTSPLYRQAAVFPNPYFCTLTRATLGAGDTHSVAGTTKASFGVSLSKARDSTSLEVEAVQGVPTSIANWITIIHLFPKNYASDPSHSLLAILQGLVNVPDLHKLVINGSKQCQPSSKLGLWVRRLHVGADKGKPLARGTDIVRVGAAEDVHIGAALQLLLGQDNLAAGGVVGVRDGVALR